MWTAANQRQAWLGTLPRAAASWRRFVWLRGLKEATRVKEKEDVQELKSWMFAEEQSFHEINGE